uniref:Replicase n=1 Tax=Lepidopteran rhabdo-related virus OKIAV3 TaxID=2746298 RepID=A0A7D7EY43_9RHAB|nr:RNA-dependent RNA polymerase [Lepidopteran rhabdo-related virus OKIAV3]
MEYDNYFNDELGDSEKKGFFFKNVDYNLNSPLLPTTLDFLASGKSKTPRKFILALNSVFQFLTLIRPPRSGPIVSTVDAFHKMIGTINTWQYKTTGIGLLVLREIKRRADITKWVPINFIRGLYKREVTDYDLEQIKDQTLKYMEYFYYVNAVVLFINARKSELHQLRTIFKELNPVVKRNRSLKDDVIELTLPLPFGTIAIYQGYAYFKFYDLILNRDCILMMKDIYLARFQSLFSYQYRNDDVYNLKTYDTLIKVYSWGDNLLKTYGGKVYKVFTMLEPLCNLRLCQLARAYRIKIPEFQKFETHVRFEIGECQQRYPGSYTIINIILNLDSYQDVLAIFSSFRHWGHPFINYREGLKELFQRLVLKRNVDISYANILASNFAKKIIWKHFNQYGSWPINKGKISHQHLFRKEIYESKWPNHLKLKEFGNNWHLLPLEKIFDIPEDIQPQVMLSDKSHSVDRDEFLSCLKSGGQVSKRVLETFRHKPSRNYRDFLTDVSTHGLNTQSLIIGLCAKEKELKEKGRYFALMSWDMREYFVSTEYLIKEHFLGYFSGITMADDQSKLVKKMLQNTVGQGRDDYKMITIANHIDYEKWCNSQSYESTKPIFDVMGNCFGLQNLFSMTHLIFQDSWVYYKHRMDLIEYKNGRLMTTNPDYQVCENGILGGLEGLRQKGWSIISLLIIEHEMNQGPTNVKVLAQGDNQVICTNFSTNPGLTDGELQEELVRIVDINNNIIKNIELGIARMGMNLNKDETMQSADYLVYGKIPIFRGQIFGLEPKRWSRVNTVSNDQVPTLGNILSSASSNALAVSMYASSPISCIYHYNFVGHFVLFMTDLYNVILEETKLNMITNMTYDQQSLHFTKILYLDPSLGGIGGTSLTRFIMRGFPDPITEGLSFWKFLYGNVTEAIQKSLCIRFGEPELTHPTTSNFSKLIENPQSLNLKKGFDGTSYIKKQVREALFKNRHQIKNNGFRSALTHNMSTNQQFLNYLSTIRPLFPRFLANLYESTWYGLVESFIRLFERSKTLLNVFGSEFRTDIDNKLKVTESAIYIDSFKEYKNLEYKDMWKCSSSHANMLRNRSWGTDLVGTTIPHPIEVLGTPMLVDETCLNCQEKVLSPLQQLNYITVLVPRGITNYKDSRGPLKAYLGSKTPEDTSIIRPYDKDYETPFTKRSLQLIKAINWLVDQDSNLAKTILNNVKAQTGSDVNVFNEQVKISGNYTHRFFSDRQSAGGYCNQSVNKLTRMSVSPDNFNNFPFEDGNHMFQSLMLYSQHVIGEIHEDNPNYALYHFHLSCENCINEVTDVKLETSHPYEFMDVHLELKKWSTQKEVKTQKEIIRPKVGREWGLLQPERKSYIIGYNQGSMYTMLRGEGDDMADSNSLFPMTLRGKLHPLPWYNGFVNGIFNQVCLLVCNISIQDTPDALLSTISGKYHDVIDSLMLNNNYINFTSTVEMSEITMFVPHKTPASYPLTSTDAASLQIFILRYLYNFHKLDGFKKFLLKDMHILPDFSNTKHMLMFQLGIEFFFTLRKAKFTHKLVKREYVKFGDLQARIRQDKAESGESKYLLGKLKTTRSQLRVIAREEIKPSVKFVDNYSLPVCKEPKGEIWEIKLQYKSTDWAPKLRIPQITCPLISGIRWVLLATGSMWKISSILHQLDLHYLDFLCGGDGSGGITALLARFNRHSRFIYNSLLNLGELDLNGTEPRPPSALTSMGPQVYSRCLNYRDSWKHPSDLTDKRAWDYFLKLKIDNNLKIGLATFDMELQELTLMDKIVVNLCEYSSDLFEQDVTVLFKTYLDTILNTDILLQFSKFFTSVSLITTQYTSSYSSEIYVRLTRLKLVKGCSSYPDKHHIVSKSVNFCPAVRSRSFELKRAQKCLWDSKFIKYPKELVSDLNVEMEQQFRMYGLPSTVIGEALLYVSVCQETQWMSTWMACFIAGSYSIVNSLRIEAHHHNIPSRTKWCNIACLYLAFHYIYVLLKDDLSVFDILNKWINHRFTLFYSFLKVTKKKKVIGTRLVWSLDKKSEKDKRLSFIIKDKAPNIAALIRIMVRSYNDRRIYKYNQNINKSYVDILLKNMNPNLTLDKVELTSGWTQLLSGLTPKIFKTTTGDILDDTEINVDPVFQDDYM